MPSPILVPMLQRQVLGKNEGLPGFHCYLPLYYTRGSHSILSYKIKKYPRWLPPQKKRRTVRDQTLGDQPEHPFSFFSKSEKVKKHE
ncbi:hypothetical protein GBA52_015290 [Prunus armeniaca]|nr:hypothetical protein GBA52_015290 [Prunus armeniaca]